MRLWLGQQRGGALCEENHVSQEKAWAWNWTSQSERSLLPSNSNTLSCARRSQTDSAISLRAESEQVSARQRFPVCISFRHSSVRRESSRRDDVRPGRTLTAFPRLSRCATEEE